MRNFFGPLTTRVSGDVSCPAGQRMVSSGASNGSITSLTPLPDFTGVSASGIILSSAANYLQVVVGCLPVGQIAGVTVRSETFVPDEKGAASGVVPCPAGTHAFGGGGYFRTAQNFPSTRSRPLVSNTVSADGTGWTFKASSLTSERLVITTQCAPLPGSYVAQAHVVIPGPEAIRREVYTDCKSGYSMLSGGVYLSKPDGTEQEGR
ncbi:hypothetical protein [Nonomuraea zeae]|uniref:Uncharacterized protein n=1 Tax=Nonomuraea zeae TaxID=1642303 RepID=A0A5S4FYH4_9ACTN|nr:hypothetical protein [Nonomuraea zeae]TMR25758.1 hypothetical protein ETD85_44770 [Nonomuraea zeae]